MALSAIESGYRGAREIRRKLDLVASQPIDPMRVAEDLGLVVVFRVFNARRVSGMHVYQKEGDVAVAVINSTDTKARQRFTLAHELGHNHFDREETIVDQLFAGGDSNLKEIRANCFAGELLLPQQAISKWRPRRDWKDSPQDVGELAIHYGVSYEAALYRLKSAECLTDNEVRTLRDRYSDLDQSIKARISERGDEETVLPQAFLELAKTARDRRLISSGKYDELISGMIEK